MKTSMVILGLVILVLVIALVFIAFVHSNRKSLSVTTTLTNSSTSVVSTSISNISSLTTSILVYPKNGTNHTITDQEVISTLGTGWTSSAQYNYDNNTNLKLANGTTETVQSYGVANFTNGGEFLATEWIQFSSPSIASTYINNLFNSSFKNTTNVTRSTQGDSNYIFYTGDAINKGQAASVIYAYDGPYAITIFNQGTSFQLTQGKELLSDQLLALNTT